MRATFHQDDFFSDKADPSPPPGSTLYIDCAEVFPGNDTLPKHSDLFSTLVMLFAAGNSASVMLQVLPLTIHSRFATNTFVSYSALFSLLQSVLLNRVTYILGSTIPLTGQLVAVCLLSSIYGSTD